MPGLAASSMVFENIRLENPNYQLYRLDWIQPKKNESIKSYFGRNPRWPPSSPGGIANRPEMSSMRFGRLSGG